LDERLRDYVIGALSEAGLRPGQFFEVSFGSLGTALLKPGITARQLGPDPLNTGVGPAVTVDSQIDDTEIDPSQSAASNSSVSGMSPCRRQVPLATDQAQINFAFAVLHQSALILPSP
jgi:hypothetical protein